MREVKSSRAWIAGGAALFAVNLVVIYVLSLGPVTSIFRCQRLLPNQPGECRLEESYVFWRDKAVTFEESTIRSAVRIPSATAVAGDGNRPVQVGLRLSSGQVVPLIGYDWPFVAETSIQRLNVYLADRSASSLVIKPNCLTSLYLFCDIIVAIILVGGLGIYLFRKPQGKYDRLHHRRRA